MKTMDYDLVAYTHSGIIILFILNFQVAGITKRAPNISPEEALEHLKNRFTSMERELQDLKYKVNRIHTFGFLIQLVSKMNISNLFS